MDNRRIPSLKPLENSSNKKQCLVAESKYETAINAHKEVTTEMETEPQQLT